MGKGGKKKPKGRKGEAYHAGGKRGSTDARSTERKGKKKGKSGAVIECELVGGKKKKT